MAFFNNLNQITGHFTPSTAYGRSFYYDETGNEVHVSSSQIPGDDRVLKWDAENRVIEIAFPNKLNSPVYTYRYDGLGRRVEVTRTETGGTPVTTRFIWCGSRLCAKHDGYWIDTMLARYFDEGQYNPQTGEKWLFSVDQLGSVRDVIDVNTGAVVGSFDYDPYGQVTASTGSAIPHYMFAGLYRAPQLGLDLSETRLYDPKHGRWLSRDSVGERGGRNLYLYAAADPTNLVDPAGTWPLIPPIGWPPGNLPFGPSPEEHQNRNQHNRCPAKPPTMCGGGTEDDFEYDARPGVGGKWRGAGGSECAYDDGGALKPDPAQTFNFEPDSNTPRHVWLDWFAHYWYWGQWAYRPGLTQSY